MIIFYIVIATSIGFVIFAGLILRSGHGYSVHDTEAHSTNYADIIKEGHGGLTIFLWVSFIVIFIWSLIYLVQHWGEFSIIFF